MPSKREHGRITFASRRFAAPGARARRLEPQVVATAMPALLRLKARLEVVAPAGQPLPNVVERNRNEEIGAEEDAGAPTMRSPHRGRYAGASPRKSFTVTLPDEPKPNFTAAAAQLTLLVVAANIFACLLAGNVAIPQPGATASIAIPAPQRGQGDETMTGRLAKLLWRDPSAP